MNLTIEIGKKGKQYVCFTRDNSMATIYGTLEDTVVKALKKYIAMFMYIRDYALTDNSIPVPIIENEQNLTIQYKEKFYAKINGLDLCQDSSLDNIFNMLIKSMN